MGGQLNRRLNVRKENIPDKYHASKDWDLNGVCESEANRNENKYCNYPDINYPKQH